MLAIMLHKGKKICNECWGDLPKEETGGRGMRPWGWVPSNVKTTCCDSCGREGYKGDSVEGERG